MNLLRLLLPALMLLLLASVAQGQCFYRLELSDAGKDGWNGGRLLARSGNRTDTITLDATKSDGVDSTVLLRVVANQTLTLTWQPGQFPTEASFILYNANDSLLLRGTDLQPGQVFSGRAVCPACIRPANFRVENVFDDRVRLRWDPIEVDKFDGWWIIYGRSGFQPGRGVGDSVFTIVPRLTLGGLKEKTFYDVYVVQQCDSTSFSRLLGPLTFETYWSDDVGICGVETPVGGCGLDPDEEVTILMRNYGARPQSLIPFDYSVDGAPAGVSMPMDGLYTGVVGKDSCQSVKFDTKFDFSQPGEYLIESWTALKGDENTRNDTFQFRLVSYLEAPYRQPLEAWGGGWTVDTASRNSSWAWGTPAGDIIARAGEGRSAWVTNLAGLHQPNERSYLTSPCFDFSTAKADSLPVLQFLLNYDLEAANDGAWAEISVDEGKTWAKLGARQTGFNWYNSANFGGAWSGRSPGWRTVRQPLPATVVGKDAVKLRISLRANATNEGEGVGVDDLQVYVPRASDLAAIQAQVLEPGSCGSATDRVAFEVANFGRSTFNTFQVAYSVNGGTPVIERVDSVIAPNQRIRYTFRASVNTRDRDSEIRCWAILPSEQNRANDTTVFRLNYTPRKLPLQENFEAGVLPTGWITDQGIVTSGHNNRSKVLAAALNGANARFSHTLPRFDTIRAGDSLRFDFRVVSFDNRGTTTVSLASSSFVQLEVSVDCGANFAPLVRLNGTSLPSALEMRTVAVALTPLVGQRPVFRIRGERLSGNPFWVDLDNFNLGGCLPSLRLSATVRTSPLGQNGGSATVTAGFGAAPFSYRWDNGSTFATRSGLAVGTYSVTVTDRFGCTDVLSVTVGTTAVQDLPGLTKAQLAPNPTTGLSNLTLVFDRPTAVQAQLFDLAGRLVQEHRLQQNTTFDIPLDLTGLNAGLYWVRLSAGGRTHVVKLVKSDN
jgi:Secretion system C-terminal sorting domain